MAVGLGSVLGTGAVRTWPPAREARTTRTRPAIRTIRVRRSHRLIGFITRFRMPTFERHRLTGWNLAAFAAFHFRALLTQNRFAGKSNAVAFDG